MNLYEEYLEQAKLVHQEGNYWEGKTLKKYITEIDQIIKDKNIDTVLDYGCGQAQHQPQHWNITSYDPAVERFNIKPTGQFDLVICIDVLEHIPQEGLKKVLNDIFSFNQKHTFLTVHSGIAIKALPNGKNAHATVMPHRWWNNLLSDYDNYTLRFTK
jgi:hypothetical protein